MLSATITATMEDMGMTSIGSGVWPPLSRFWTVPADPAAAAAAASRDGNNATASARDLSLTMYSGVTTTYGTLADFSRADESGSRGAMPSTNWDFQSIGPDEEDDDTDDPVVNQLRVSDAESDGLA